VDAWLGVASALDAPDAGRHLAFAPGPEATHRGAALLASRPGHSVLVGLHPGGGPYSTARRWSAEGFAAVGTALAERGAGLVVVGRAGDETLEVARRLPAASTLDLTDRTPDLATLAAVLGHIDLLVTNDSGVMHLATAMGTAVVAVFGPSNPVAWGPWHAGAGPSPHRVVALDLPCRPCLYVDHRLGAPDGCCTRDCLAWMPAERVLAAALDTLSGKNP
jgi:heptosyltransferase-2